MGVIFFREGTEIGDGRYKLRRRIGAGGMATVWLANDCRLHRPVAIKIPSDALSHDPVFNQRFEREARTAASLSHPNLVSVHDYGWEGERPFLVSEYIDGASLDKLRQRGEAPSTEELATSILAALAAVHSSGIVHRDVKPGNVMVSSDGRILLTDFGIAQPDDSTSLTMTGNVVGTVHYLAPEVMRGERAGPPADLYACGVVLRDSLGDDDPNHLGYLVERLTADKPSDRPPTAEHALAELDPSEETTATVPLAAAPPPQPPTLRERTAEQTAQRSVPPPPAPPSRRPPSRTPPPTSSGGSSDRSRWLIPGLLAGMAVLALIVIIASSGGGDDPAAGTATNAQQNTSTSDEPPEASTTTSTETTTEAAPTTPEPTQSTGGSIDEAIALNDQGFSLLSSGDAEGALEPLSQSVAMFPEDSTDINYAYALFNYAQALRLTGSPAEAIPLLEKRLAISDFKVEEVEAELKTAEKEAKG